VPGHGGAPLPEKRRGPPRLPGASLFLCPLIRSGCSSACSCSETIPRSCLSASHGLAPSPMIGPARHEQASPVIDGRALSLSHRYDRDRCGRDTGCRWSCATVPPPTPTCLAQQWPRSGAHGRWVCSPAGCSIRRGGPPHKRNFYDSIDLFEYKGFHGCVGPCGAQNHRCLLSTVPGYNVSPVASGNSTCSPVASLIMRSFSVSSRRNCSFGFSSSIP
jgi:hypothetical protein